MEILALIGIFFITYLSSNIFLTWKNIKKSQLERLAETDIEMQKVMLDFKSKVVKFEPRNKK